MSLPWRRRAKPGLGTQVEITILADGEPELMRATDAAFSRIADIHRAMSFHEATSEVRALARAPAGAQLRLCADTSQVLRLALELERDSGGIFNVAVAPWLVASGALPEPDGAQAPLARSLAAGIDWVTEDTVQVRTPLWIDLGGIAKGYAVDAAVEALRACGVQAGLVNAGGDMRAFGPHAHVVHLRFASGMKAIASLQDGALASSCHAHLFADDAATTAPVPHVDPRSGLGVRSPNSVVVQAATAVLADALTKVALVCPQTADRLCRSRDAQWRAFDYFDA